MCYLTDGAQDYLNRIDRQAQIDAEESELNRKEYECNSCSRTAKEGEGLITIIDGEDPFCKWCMDENKHITFYKDHTELSDREIWELIKNAKTV